MPPPRFRKKATTTSLFFGEVGHNTKHGTAIFPDAMRWLWHDVDVVRR